MIRVIVKQLVPIGLIVRSKGVLINAPSSFHLDRTNERSIIARCFHRSQIEPPIVWQTNGGAPAAYCGTSIRFPTSSPSSTATLSHIPSVSSRGSRDRTK